MKLFKVKVADSVTTAGIAKNLSSVLSKFPEEQQKEVKKLIDFCKKNDDASVKEYYDSKLQRMVKTVIHTQFPFIEILFKTL